MKLSSAELDAIDWLRAEGGSILVSKIPDTNERDVVFKTVTPGLPVFRKLERKGLIFFTEEEPFEIEPGVWFEFTPEVYLVTGSNSVTN